MLAQDVLQAFVAIVFTDSQATSIRDEGDYVQVVGSYHHSINRSN